MLLKAFSMLVFIIYREKHLYSGTLVSNEDIGKKKSCVKERENGGGMVRQESWINEVLRINSHIGRINEMRIDIIPNWRYVRNNADIPRLSAI
jgi:hypothetical protein